MMYESPIQMMIDEIQSQMDENIVRVVQNVGISVDNDELVKALNYDRCQYEKGYTDGKNDAVVHGHWEHDETGANFCSVCDKYPYDDGEYHLVWHTGYCPHCGAKMD